jgi:hypothetical protein
MPGRQRAPTTGRELEQRTRDLAERLGLEVRSRVRVGRRLWGSVREIDLVLTDATTRRRLGIECKAQGSKGTAEEKIPATITDIGAWPIPGLVVFSGAGFSPNMELFLLSTGKAVSFEDLEDWLRLYFGLPIKDELL